MAENLNHQQYSSNYAPVAQSDSFARIKPGVARYKQFSQRSGEIGSVSSVDEDDRNAYELSPVRNTLSPSTRDDRVRGSSMNIRENDLHLLKKEWKSWKISWWFTTISLVVEFGFVITIFILERTSVRKAGIATVSDYVANTSEGFSTPFANNRQYLGLLWTALPAFIFSLYSRTFAAIVAACYERQPFIELQRGGSVRRTIMLDYRAYPGLYGWFVALRRRHWHLGCAMLLSLIMTIFIVPLSSHLFVASAHSQSSGVSLNFPTQYNDSISIATTNLEPFIDIATAVHAYGSTPPAWMTVEYAFAPFSVPPMSSATPLTDTSLANISATTDAYSAYLDCRAVDSRSYEATYQTLGVSQGFDEGKLTVAITDGSCFLGQTVSLSNSTQVYAQTWQQACDGQTDGRVGILAGIYSAASATKLNNLSVISCTPSYWHSVGSLTVSLDSNPSSIWRYISFDEQNSTMLQPSFARILENAITQYFFFNAAATTRSDALGFAILSAAKRFTNDAVGAMNTGVLLNATERVFTTFYAGLATTLLLVPGPAVSGHGNSLQTVTRLFVTRSIAYTIVTVLLFMLLNHLVLYWYSFRHPSMLSEEPIGVLGNAIVLERSNVGQVLNQVRTSGEVDDVRSTLKEDFDVDRATCYWDSHENRIRVDGLIQKQKRK